MTQPSIPEVDLDGMLAEGTMMTSVPKDGAGGSRPGVMGDGSEEQNLDQPGNPDARIKSDEVEEAFGGAKPSDEAAAKPEDTLPKDNSHNFV